MSNPLAERFAEHVWAVLEGDPAPLQRLIETGGGTWRATDDGIVVRRADGFTVGLAQTDPSNCAVTVGFALFGPLWPFVPAATAGKELVQRQWAVRSKAKKATQRR